MSFIFRTVFWLGLAIVILPPQARLGGGDTADFEHVDLGLEIQNAMAAAWAFGAGTLRGCETNPELCKAGSDLLNTSLSTGSDLAGELQNQWEKPPAQRGEAEPRAAKKIQARVE